MRQSARNLIQTSTRAASFVEHLNCAQQARPRFVRASCTVRVRAPHVCIVANLPPTLAPFPALCPLLVARDRRRKARTTYLVHVHWPCDSRKQRSKKRDAVASLKRTTHAFAQVTRLMTSVENTSSPTCASVQLILRISSLRTPLSRYRLPLQHHSRRYSSHETLDNATLSQPSASAALQIAIHDTRCGWWCAATSCPAALPAPVVQPSEAV